MWIRKWDKKVTYLSFVRLRKFLRFGKAEKLIQIAINQLFIDDWYWFKPNLSISCTRRFSDNVISVSNKRELYKILLSYPFLRNVEAELLSSMLSGLGKQTLTQNQGSFDRGISYYL